MMTDNRESYRTALGFYEGDQVELADGRKGYINRMLQSKINFHDPHDPDLYYEVSLVVVKGANFARNGELWLDYQLTRIA